MSASRRKEGELVLGVKEARVIADLTEALAHGLGMIGSYRIGEAIPRAAYGPVARAAARLALLLGGLAVRGVAREPRPTIH